MSSQALTLGELAKELGADLEGDPRLPILGVNGLENASPDQLSYLASEHYLAALRRSKAGAIVIDPSIKRQPRRNYLITVEPAQLFDRAVRLFHPPEQSASAFTGVHPTAVVHESATLAEGVEIGPYAVVDRNVAIGKGSKIGAHVYVGPGVSLGERVVLHPHVVIHGGCSLGDRVAVYSGTVIGGTGYGYITDRQGHHHHLTHVAAVVIEEDVEIGANCVIDRGHFRNTWIRRGSKIDGMVQIAHGVEIGEHNLIVGQSGIAGSSKTGRHVILAGQVGVKDHVELADGVICGARTGVMKSLTEPGKYAGEPAAPVKELGPQMLAMRKITQHVARISELERRLAELEDKVNA